MTTLVAALVCALTSAGKPGIVYDSGEPLTTSDGSVVLMSVWQVLDPLDNLAVSNIRPIEIKSDTTVTAISVYALSPNSQTDRIVDIYVGTSQDSPGVLAHSLRFERHTGTREGWTLLVLEQPITLAAGRYGVSYRGNMEFETYWAANAPNGDGYSWIRQNGQSEWQRVTREDIFINPNFALRVYGTLAGEQSDGVLETPEVAPRHKLRDGGIPNADALKYTPGTATSPYHFVRRALVK